MASGLTVDGPPGSPQPLRSGLRASEYTCAAAGHAARIAPERSPMFERTVLKNGLRVVSSTMPHTRSVSIGLYVAAGSRYEHDESAGVSHFLEHMLFKGTKRRPTAQQISEEIEGVGGSMN